MGRWREHLERERGIRMSVFNPKSLLASVMPVYERSAPSALREGIAAMKAIARRARLEIDRLQSRRTQARHLVLSQFVPPPYGGGNQFLRALWNELEQRRLAAGEQHHLADHARVPLQLVQLRSRSAAALPPRRLRDGASR